MPFPILPFPLTRRRGAVPPFDPSLDEEEYGYAPDAGSAPLGVMRGESPSSIAPRPLDPGPERIGYPSDRVDAREFFDPPPAVRIDPARGIVPAYTGPGNVRPRGSTIEGLLERERAAPLAAPLPTSDQPLDAQLQPGRRRPPLPYPDIPMPDTGIVVEDSPINRRRRDYIMENAARNPDGSFTGPGENVHIKRSWKQVIGNALRGAADAVNTNPNDPNLWARALGGMATGGIGTAVNPMGGRAYAFDTSYAPQIERQLAEQEAERQRREQEQDRRLKVERQRADMQRIQGQTKDADLERRYRESQIGRNESAAALADARAQAAMTGRPVIRDIVSDGKVVTVQVHPDGGVTSLGGSAKATMQGEALRTREGIAGRQIESRENIAGQQIQSREGIAGQQIQSREGIAGQSDTGRNQRAAGGKPGVVPPAVYAAAKNVTTLKTDAEGAWEAWKSFVPNPAKNPADNDYDHEQLRVAASRAQAKYNSAAQSLGQQHGKHFKVTPNAGGSGWHYVEPIQPEEQAAPTGGRGIVPAQTTTRPASQIEGSPKFPGWQLRY